VRRYYLTNNPTGALATWTVLPISAKPLTAGVEYAKYLRRAVQSDTWVLGGDGKAIPKPWTIGMQLDAATPEDLEVLEQAIRSAANTATSVMAVTIGTNIIRRRDVLGIMEEPITLSRGTTSAIMSLTFGPKKAWWTFQNDTGQFLF
jgi:hypothetical protein